MKRYTISKWKYSAENEILHCSSGQGWLGGLNAVEHNFEGNDDKWGRWLGWSMEAKWERGEKEITAMLPPHRRSPEGRERFV